MVEEEILEVEQEIRGLSALEQESRALEEADAKAVEAAREKRQLRKKKALRRKLFILLFIFFAAASGIGIFFYQRQQKEAAANATVEITAEEGQQILYAKITQIQGNEITFEEMDPNVSDMPAETSSKPPADSSLEIPGEGPLETSGKNPLDPSAVSSTKTPGENPLDQPDESSPETPSKSSSDPPAEASSETSGKSRTMQIPVGTEVITMLGAVTTFSRLDADDTVAIVLEGDDIIRIYIIQ